MSKETILTIRPFTRKLNLQMAGFFKKIEDWANQRALDLEDKEKELDDLARVSNNNAAIVQNLETTLQIQDVPENEVRAIEADIADHKLMQRALSAYKEGLCAEIKGLIK